jgi:hypothetical protein
MVEIENIQESFVVALGFGIELALALLLLLALYFAVLWVFSVPGSGQK